MRMYSSQLFYGVQDLPYFFSSSLIVDDCGWFSIWLRPWEEFTSIGRFAVLFPQRSWGPHGNRTHIVWGYPGYPRTSLCLITVFGADTTISSWFSSTISTTIFPWSVASLGYEYGHRYTEESRRLGIRWSKVWPSDYSGFCYLYPLVTLWFMSENSYWSHGPVEIVDLPIKHGDFP